MDSNRILLAVNGTLMRGLELNPNLLAVAAEFVRATTTEPAYRMWSINDYLDSIEKTIDRLKLFEQVVSKDDIETRREIEREVSILGELYDRLAAMNTNITFLTVH